MAGKELVPLPSTAVAYSVPLVPHDYTHPGLTVSQIASIMWAYRRVTLLILIGALALSAAVAVLMPKTYQATAVLMVNYEVNDPLSGKEYPLGLLGGYMATQLELMKSPEVLLGVVDQLHLTKNKDYIAGHDGDGSTLRQRAAQRLEKYLTIRQGELGSNESGSQLINGQLGSQLINVTYSAHNAKEAADVANTLVSVYVQQHLQRSIGPAAAVAKRYADQLEGLKNKVNDAQTQVTTFRTNNGLTTLNSSLDNESKNLETLEQGLLDIQAKRRVAEARIAGNPSYGSDVLGSPLVQGLKTQLATQQARMAELSTTLGPRNPQIIELNSQIAATRHSLESETQSYSTNASGDLIAVRSQEKKLQAAVDAQRQKVIHTRQLQDEGEKYRLNLDSAQSVYKTMLDGYDRMTSASRGRYNNISVASRARAPLQATRPKPLEDMITGAVLGLGLGLFGPLCYELLFNRRVRCRDDLEHDHGIAVIGEFSAIHSTRSLA